MPAQLISQSDTPNILLDKPILLLGRHPECDIQIDSRKISRRHCCIAQVSDYLVIRDLGSTNGIRINGERVLEGRLKPNDELTIGNSSYKVSWDSIAPVKPPPVSLAPRDQKLPLRRTKLDRLDDEALENCDEPVPLDDADEDAVGLVFPAIAVPEAKPPNEAPLLPENLELAPLSDVRPPRNN